MLTRSEDGYHWTPPEDALLPSREGWDSGGVLTANVTEWEGLYYLFYTGVDPQFDVTHSRRYAGYGVSESPLGPWKRGAEPLLGPGGKGFDEDSADDVTVFYKDGKFRMYYKGSYPGLDGNHTEIGVAFSDSITGPYRRYEGNPIMPGHAFAIWPYAGGYLYLSGRKDTNEGTVYNDDPEWKDPRGRQSLFWSEDGLAFEPCCPFENRAPGIYAGSTTDLTKCWGVSVKTRNGSMGRYIARFDFRL
jgi:beta-xylosidase